MVIFPYNFSNNLQVAFSHLQNSRVKLLTIALPTKIETRFRWEGTLQKIHWVLALEGNTPTKREIGNLLTLAKIANPTPAQINILAYKQALDYIKKNWYVNLRPITPATINTLYSLAIKPGSKSMPTKAFLKDIRQLMNYISQGSDHPVTQAGCAYYHTLTNPNLKEGNIRLASLVATLILYRNGLDYRGVLCFEEVFMTEIKEFRRMIEYTAHTKSLTVWLEYFANCIHKSLNLAIKDISAGKFTTDIKANFWKINNRQKDILTKLEVPEEKITNKMVQDMFKISQITASRDLAHMVKLGLIASFGKGRSTYYIKI